MTLPIIIDTDPGIDDVTIECCPITSILRCKMISTVNGNVSIEKRLLML